MIDVANLSKTARYTPTEVAEMLGCTVKTVGNYRQRGQLKARVNRFNGRYYYTGEELMRFVRTM